MMYDINPYSKGLYDEIKCPYCGKSHFQVGGSVTTAMYCPTIIKDGRVVSTDSNISTTTFYCQECGKAFKQVSSQGESRIEKIEPQPEANLYINNKELYNITIDEDGVVIGTDDLATIPSFEINRHRKCNICGNIFVSGPCMQCGIGPDTDKYICDECAKSLKILIGLIPVIQENSDEIQVLKDKLREKSKKEVNFKE